MGEDAKTRAKHPVVVRFRTNARGFFAAYRWLLLLFLASLFCDAASTIHFMLKLGPEPEMNPAVRMAARIAGPVAGPLIGAVAKSIAGILVAIYCRKFAAYIFILTALISFWAAWYNVWGVELYYPMFMRHWP